MFFWVFIQNFISGDFVIFHKFRRKDLKLKISSRGKILFDYMSHTSTGKDFTSITTSTKTST